MRILIADEEPLEALTVAEILTLCGHQVIGPAFGADEARQLSHERPPSLAFIAVNFDAADAGITLARQLHEAHSTAVILTTSDPDVVRSCDWALGVLRKPYDPDDIASAAQAVESLFNGNAPPPHQLPAALQLSPSNARISAHVLKACRERTQSPPILLVEDHPKDAELAIVSLRQNQVDNEVIVARDGQEAIECLEQRRINEPALILLDLSMPSCDGLEVLRRLKQEPRWRGIPVVVFSASNDASLVRRCYEHGVNAYVVKPTEYPRFAKSLGLVGRFWTQRNKYPSKSQIRA